jgi:hypothetical protein
LPCKRLQLDEIWSFVCASLGSLFGQPFRKTVIFQYPSLLSMAHYFNEDVDRPNMQFVQRRSLISRHVPLKYGEQSSRSHLPLTGVVVGPCRFKAASRVAVGDMLVTNGYDPNSEVTISETSIPYREV